MSRQKHHILKIMIYNNGTMATKSKIELPPNGSLGERIASLRKESKYSQSELAKKLGISQKVISDYELNRLRPHYENIIKLALIFEITTDELLGIKSIKHTPKKPNKKILRRMERIEALPESQQKFILRSIDSHLKALDQ